ncbi:Fanconi anemia group G protein isoform X2 [Engystomops pustulosus]|uniref:Fanconi anemia group G protein isoform X2 n=1 Tax=Engystomops pustulosus TaxID=76066 RepID=UPI003AFA53E6
MRLRSAPRTSEGLGSPGGEMEVDAAEDEDCRTWWTQENNDIIRAWKDSETFVDTDIRRQRRQQCRSDLLHLLQKIQGLPPEPLSLPLELSVLYNMVIAQCDIPGAGRLAEHSVQVQDVLSRAVEVLVPGGTAGTGLWEQVLSGAHSWEMTCALYRLAGLQGALWLSGGRLRDAVDLFSLLSQTPDLQNSSHEENDLPRLIRAWKVPVEEPGTILTLQTTGHIKEVLYNAASLLQGVAAMKTSEFPRAVTFLQEAAGSLCSSRGLAEIYTCLGYSFYKMGKPQVSLQYWQRALKTDFGCLSALYHSSVLYRDTGATESELEALALLHAALESPSSGDSSRKMPFPLRTECIIGSAVLSSFVHTPSSLEVKYLMARMSLRSRSIEQAAGHYLELLSALLDDPHPQGLHPSPAPLPRIPIIHLEAAASLLENERFQDAVTVCSELLERLGHVTGGVLRIDDPHKAMSEQLNCILWASSTHLLQGEAWGMLGDHRESIADFTRCINLLAKVQCGDYGSGELAQNKVCGILKAAAFLGRGNGFLQTGDEAKAVMSAKLSLQSDPAFPGVASCLVDALWRLGRKEEAACQWRMFQSNKDKLHQQWEGSAPVPDGDQAEGLFHGHISGQRTGGLYTERREDGDRSHLRLQRLQRNLCSSGFIQSYIGYRGCRRSGGPETPQKTPGLEISRHNNLRRIQIQSM